STKMQDFGAAPPCRLVVPSTRAATTPGVLSESMPAAPACRKCRRESVDGGWRLLADVLMAVSPRSVGWRGKGWGSKAERGLVGSLWADRARALDLCR